MNVIQFGDPSCEKTRRYMDSYLSNELLVETNHEVLRHLEGCAHCTDELGLRARVRAEVRAAVRRTPVPAGLEGRVQQALRTRPARVWYWRVAAALLIGLAALAIWRLRPAAESPQNAIMREAAQRLSAVLDVGMRDHLNCAVFRKYSKQPDPATQMATQLGPQFAGLAPLVQAKAPAGFQVIQGHRCDYKGRQYVHLILVNGNTLMSVILTRKETGESLNGGISQSAFDRYNVVGFENADYLGYVISDLDAPQNLQVASTLAPAVREYLAAHAG